MDRAVEYSDGYLRHWVAALLGRAPSGGSAGIALNPAFLTEGVYLSSYLGHEVTAEEIEAAQPGLGRIWRHPPRPQVATPRRGLRAQIGVLTIVHVESA